MKNKFLVWFEEVGKEDVRIVGGKGANTGEMVSFSIPVPKGFIVTSQAYFHFLDKAKLRGKIREELTGLDVEDPVALKRASDRIKKELVHAPIPENISSLIFTAYSTLGQKIARSEKNIIHKLERVLKDPLVAIRSSATAEDLPTASFAGQQETYLNIKGESNVVQAVRKCWASLFEARAIYYRVQNHFDHFKVGIAVLVQQMVQSETSGVMFTIDPTNNDKKRIVVEAIYGLGELIVQGSVTPDHYEVDKMSLDLLKKEMGTQTVKLVKIGTKNKELRVPKNLQSKQKIKNREITEIARLGKRIERHYFFPQDIEWAIENGIIYIVQTRPITTIKQTSTKQEITKEEASSLAKLHLILTGSGASPGIASGVVKILQSVREIKKIQTGDILVASQTNPDFVPAMRKAVAIVTDKGGRTSHAAIVSRELGIPCIVGTEKATKILKDGMAITVNAVNGKIYKGTLQFHGSRAKSPTRIHIETAQTIVKTATKVYVNLAEPEMALEISKRNVDGVGLLRAEFMIANIGTHPKKLIREGKSRLFIDKLSSEIATFCESFNPRPVIYRATDFKTNEYRNLKGGKLFEPEEPNPMLGYRGVFRYIHDPEVFSLEIDAIKKVRNKMGYRNLWLMLPFVRTVKELVEVKKLIAARGLVRSPSFKLLMMVEIPSNVILLEKFIEAGIDGVSIGSNDLTMLLLGTDRDNSEVASEFDERNEAVLWALEKVIKTCHKLGVTSSICGQAPSDYPDLTEKLVHWGITGVSVNPDVIEQTRQIVYEAEKRKVDDPERSRRVEKR